MNFTPCPYMRVRSRIGRVKHFLLMITIVTLAGCGKKEETSQKSEPTEAVPANIADPIVEKAIRIHLKKPKGALTEADLEQVTRLHLSSTQITDAGLKEVAKLKQLEYINLNGTQITDEGLKEVANLQRLTSLHLSSTQITDAGLKDIAKLKQLSSLSLFATQITDEGLKDVAKLQQLKSIDLFGNKVTKAGMAQLKKALPKCEIISP